jgi:hypothetical protein
MRNVTSEVGYHKILKVIEEETGNSEMFTVGVHTTEEQRDVIKHVDLVVSQPSPITGKMWKRAYRFSSSNLVSLAEDYHAHTKIEQILEDLVSTVALCLFYGKQMY